MLIESVFVVVVEPIKSVVAVAEEVAEVFKQLLVVGRFVVVAGHSGASLKEFPMSRVELAASVSLEALFQAPALSCPCYRAPAADEAVTTEALAPKHRSFHLKINHVIK